MNSKVIQDLNKTDKFLKYFTNLELQKLLGRTFDVSFNGIPIHNQNSRTNWEEYKGHGLSRKTKGRGLTDR